jgi:hypothetical protein
MNPLSDSKKDSRSALIATVAFWISATKFIVSGAEIRLSGWHIKLADLDPTLLAVFMVTCFGLYWGRRATDAYERIKGPCVGEPLVKDKATKVKGAIG